MKLSREVIEKLISTDGQEVIKGDTVVFNTGGRTIIGIYDGIAPRGAWIFKGIKNFEDVTFNVSPNAIERLYKVEVSCNE